MKELLSPKQVARATGVSESSLKRWCDRGVLSTIRTAGGHRRIPVGAVMSFLRDTGRELVRPEVLGLPAVSGRGSATIPRGRESVQAALVSGDHAAVRRTLFDLYLAGNSLTDLCDQLIAEAFAAIGNGWECGKVQVYQERRACEICLRALHEIEAVLPTPQQDAPVAFGGTLDGDHYQLPTATVEIALREAGWRAKSFGTGLPVTTLCEAIDQIKPRLLWLSVSNLEEANAFVERYQRLYAYAESKGVPIVVGGRALTTDVRRQLTYAAFCDNLRQLRAFVTTIRPLPTGTANIGSTSTR